MKLQWRQDDVAKALCGFWVHSKYRIRPNYRTYPYKRTVNQFRSRQISASVVFVYFFMN